MARQLAIKHVSVNTSVKGSLKAHSAWWNNNFNNAYVLNIINNGYDLPLISLPEPSFINNNKSARDHPEFVTAEIAKLLAAGIIEKQRLPPTVVSPLTVAENSVGKLRLVLDLRTINPLIHVDRCKFEDIKAASTYFTKGCYMVCFDLKSGYHHIDVNPSYHQYLGFCWQGLYYTYSVLAFGLSSAGLAFTKVLKELVKRWRAKSIPVVLYLDDGIIIAQSKSIAEHYAQIIQQDLKHAGFIVNEQKTCWIPKQRVEWLGFRLMSDINVFEVPYLKLFRLQCTLFKNLICRNKCSARLLAKSVGKISCLFHALGSIVYIMTKNSQCWIAERDSWGDNNALPESVLGELRFWHENINNVRRMPLEKPLSNFSVIIYSDASATGCGAFIKACQGTELVHYWTSQEQKLSSTWRELKTVEIYMQEKLNILAGLNLKWYTDNQAVPRIIYKGSMVSNLQESALKIFKLCVDNHIELSIDWIPRTLNEQADDLSKRQDTDDWQVQKHIFDFLNRVAGPFSLDCFATNLSAKVERFYAKYCCAGVLGVDAFAFDWGGELLWLVPPPKLISKVISHCKLCRAKGILIIPKWQSSVFWPLIMLKSGWAPGISLKYEYKNPGNFFARGPFGNSCFSEARFSSNVLVLELNYSDFW
jgi:hypothetical protein